MTYYVLANRDKLIECLPPGAVGAEVGVFAGEFAATILTKAQPSELHLIDAWRSVALAGREWSSDYRASQQATFARYLKAAEPSWDGEDLDQCLAVLYERVQKRFTGDDRVRIVRGLSSEVLATYPDQYFDFLYLDADHDYHGLLSDLWAAHRILKQGGLIFGHDFDMDRSNKYSKHNVIGNCSPPPRWGRFGSGLRWAA